MSAFAQFGAHLRSRLNRSFFDILYLGRIFPKRATIMAKKELKWMPLLGWYSEQARRRCPPPEAHIANPQ